MAGTVRGSTITAGAETEGIAGETAEAGAMGAVAGATEEADAE